MSRDQLLDQVWGYEHYPTTRTVDAHIVRLRRKLEPVPDEPKFFPTVHGVGSKFVGDVLKSRMQQRGNPLPEGGTV